MKGIRFVYKYFYALISSMYLFICGWFRGTNRDLISQIAFHFGYARKKENPEELLIPKIKIKELITAVLPVRMPEAEWQKGNVSLLELLVINHLLQSRKPQHLFEIGTFDGRTTLNFAANTSEDARIWTLDLPQEQIDQTKMEIEERERQLVEKKQSGARFVNTAYASKITQLYGDSAAFDYAPYEGTIDFVFIDASHAYEYVLNDSRAALELIRTNEGIILWHDYGEWNGVTRALNELYQSGHSRFASMRHVEGTSLVLTWNA